MNELKSMPLLPGANSGRPVAQVESSKLNEISFNGSAFTIHTGDIITFPDSEPLVVGQKVNSKPDSPTAYYVAVYRNGSPSWLGIGILTRRDKNGKPLGAFQEEMLKKASFVEIYESLRGKTIKGGPAKEHQFAVFVDGKRTDDVRTRMIAEIQWA